MHVFLTHFAGNFQCVDCHFQSYNRVNVMNHYERVHRLAVPAQPEAATTNLPLIDSLKNAIDKPCQLTVEPPKTPEFTDIDSDDEYIVIDEVCGSNQTGGECSQHEQQKLCKNEEDRDKEDKKEERPIKRQRTDSNVLSSSKVESENCAEHLGAKDEAPLALPTQDSPQPEEELEEGELMDDDGEIDPPDSRVSQHSPKCSNENALPRTNRTTSRRSTNGRTSSDNHKFKIVHVECPLEDCAKSFSTSRGLDEHMRIVHKILQSTCLFDGCTLSYETRYVCRVLKCKRFMLKESI